MTMKVKIRFFTILREITNNREETLNLPDNQKATVATVLKLLSEKYGKPFDTYVFEAETGQVKGFLQFLINGNSASTLNGLDTALSDGDVLAILPPVGGG
jgi:molybdopterin synthase sulfur carrier subunit